MKYYYNEKTETLLIDTNDYTPYLAERGYNEISKAEYERIGSEQEERYRLEHPEEYEEIGE